MGQNSKIQWCDYTFNPWIGCTKVSPGCVNCYASVSTAARSRKIVWGPGQPRQRTAPENWKLPLQWNRQAQMMPLQCLTCGQRFSGAQIEALHVCPVCKTVPRVHLPRVFCASLADWLDEEVPIAWLADLMQLIHQTPCLNWLLLTKRPHNWKLRLVDAYKSLPARAPHYGMLRDWLLGTAPLNVQLGTTVEDQQRAWKRWPQLMRLPAAGHFISMEPLLEAVDLVGLTLPNWVIVGGESGPNARPCNVEWIRSIRDQCQPTTTAVFIKQLGSRCLGKAGRLPLKDPKGGNPLEWPADLRVRQLPHHDQPLA